MNTIKLMISAVLVGMLTTPAFGSWCLCSLFPPCLGNKTITSHYEEPADLFVGGTPTSELNGNVVCIGTPPQPTKAPTKHCATSVTVKVNGEVELGSNFSTADWLAINLKASAGAEYTTACNATIDSWCQCCICVCHIPKTTIYATGSCDDPGCVVTDGASVYPIPCSKPITDTATSYGWVSCTTTWDKDGDGRDDCWNSMPNPCHTSCETSGT